RPERPRAALASCNRWLDAPDAACHDRVRLMVLTLDLEPAVRLQRQLAKAAFATGAMIYFEGIVALVVLTEGARHPLLFVPVAAVIAAQLALVRRPLGLLIAGRLTRAYTLMLAAGAIHV